MTTQRTAPEGGNPEGRNDQLAAGSLPSVPPDTVTNTTDTATRCHMCRHPLFAAKSCSRSIGPVCRRRIAASVTLPGWRVETVVAADHGAIALVLVPLAVAP